MAKALARGLRVGDLLGRYGGEEFCIVLPDCDLAQALQIAERLRSDIELDAGRSARRLGECMVTMSFGVEQIGSAQEFAPLLEAADASLYHSKQTGRNRVSTSSGHATAPTAPAAPG